MTGWQIVHKYHTMILQTAIAYSFEVQRGLYWGIAHHSRTAGEVLAIDMESFQQEVGMIETGNGKPRQGIHHIGMVVPTILRHDTLCLWRQQIGVEWSRNIGVKLIEVLQLIARIEHPVRITEHTDTQFGMRKAQAVELGHCSCQFLRTAGVENHHILLTGAER